MSSQPLISVIVPFYNAENFIAETVHSIQQQAYEPLQIIIINDGSTDNSLKIIESFDTPMKIISQANAGPAQARNRGLQHAKGEFIAFLDADDLWPEGKLANQLAYLKSNEKVEAVWGRTQYFGDFSERDLKLPLAEDRTAYSYQLGAGFFRRSAFEKVGLFDGSFRYSEDYDWILRMREMGIPHETMPQITLLHRMHQDSMVHSPDNLNYQLTLLVKKSLDRRRQKGEVEPLPSLPDRKR